MSDYEELLKIKAAIEFYGFKSNQIPVYWWDESVHGHIGSGPLLGRLTTMLRRAKKGGDICVWDDGLNCGEWLPVREIELDRERWQVWLITDSMLGGIGEEADAHRA